jgi:hypothetical protein
MNIVVPKIMTSPISGNPMKPVISERRIGDKIYVEAKWTDPASGVFVHRGIVKILDAETREDVTSEVHFH